jgi:hypothetical protein
MIVRGGAAATLLCVTAALVSLAGSGATDPDPRAVLSDAYRFTRQDFADLAQRKIVKHTLKGGASEIAVAGAVRVHAPKTRLLERIRDITTFKRGPDILQIGTFSTPPAEHDLASLTVGEDDFDVSNCRVHDCDIRLPADAIARMAAIDAHDGDRQTAGAALLKQMIFEQVSAFASGQPGRFAQYDDGDRAIRPLDAFAGLLDLDRALDALVPGLRDHLRRFPTAPPAGAEEVLYWSKEKFGIDPFITVTHMTIVCPSSALCVVVSNDVYSTRYIDASLSVTIAIDAPPPAGGFDLIYVNRTRASALTGFMSGLRRAIAERRARKGLDERLEATRAMLER